MVQNQAKTAIVEKFRKHEKDTGSSEVQVALLTARINQITEHVRTASKDHSSKRGLMMLVNNRRRLLDYIKKNNESAYKELIGQLDLRK